MKVEYSILPPHTNNPTEEEKEDFIEQHLGHCNEAGFFPIGVDNTWHGGVHLEEGLPVTAIADGRIIAYRIPENYLSEKGNEDIKYSNGFILIQHDFETPGEKKLRFYSLYMHLMPKKQMENSKCIPDIYAKYTVETLETEHIGLRVRQYCAEHTKRTEARETDFVPLGKMIKEDPTVVAPANHWTCTDKHYAGKYKFCELNGYTICAHEDYLDKVPGQEGTFTVRFNLNEPDLNCIYEKGTMVFDGVKGRYKSYYLPKKELAVELLPDSEWYKVKGTNYFILKSQCSERTKKIKDDVVLNVIKNVDVPIKAQQIIGMPSKYATEKNKEYTIVHLEVFTDDERVKKFIDNDETGKISYKIEAGKTLQVGMPCNFLRAETRVKIYEGKSGDNYIQIGFEDVKANVEYVHLYDFEKKDSVYSGSEKEEKNIYYIKEEHFEEVNKELDNVFPSYEYYSRLEPSKRYVYLEKWNKNNKDNGDRDIAYGFEKSGRKYWVDACEIEVKDNTGTWATLTKDIDIIYEEKPIDELKEKTIEITTKARKLATTEDNQGLKWYYMKTRHEEGWIKESEVVKKNPYKWTDYGWKIIKNAGDGYFYIFGDEVGDKKVPDFINQIWKEVDDDGNKILSSAELQRYVVRHKHKVQQLSKFICKHENEWNTWENIEKYGCEYEALTEKAIDCILSDGGKNKIDFVEKQKLIEQRDKKLERLEDKIKNLCFWDKIKSGDLTSKEARWQTYKEANLINTGTLFGNAFNTRKLKAEFEEKEAKRIKRYFPTKNSKVYHFHPHAFGEHMKLIFTKEDIDLSESSKWFTQWSPRWTPKEQKTACYKACNVVLANYGVKCIGLGNTLAEKYENNTFHYSNVIQAVNQMPDGTLKNTGYETKVVDHIDKELESGRPVIIGVDRDNKYYTKNKDNSTEHFVVITGRRTDTKGLYYRFFEVGTRYVKIGTNIHNKLYLQDDFRLVGKSPINSTKNYTLTQVRKNNL